MEDVIEETGSAPDHPPVAYAEMPPAPDDGFESYTLAKEWCGHEAGDTVRVDPERAEHMRKSGHIRPVAEPATRPTHTELPKMPIRSELPTPPIVTDLETNGPGVDVKIGTGGVRSSKAVSRG